jgi:hypothetical protein
MFDQAVLPSPAFSFREKDRSEATSSAGFWAALILMLGTIVVYLPVLGLDFVEWDDNQHLLENKRVNPPLLKNTLLYWHEKSFFGMYIPVTYTAWTLIAIASRTPANAQGHILDPYVFHLVNMLAHVLVTLQVFRLLRRYVRGVWPACLGALLFAVHPVQAEPVAWVSGFRDVLCAFLSLLALDITLGIWAPSDQPGLAQSHPRWRYALATLCFILAMLSKPTAMTVPLMVIVLAAGMEKRPWREVLRVTGPWLLLTIPFLIMTKLAQPSSQTALAVPLWQRGLVATDALAFYLYKLFLPLHMAIDYGRTPAVAREHGWLWWTWIAPLAAAAAAVIHRKRHPVLGIATLLMVATLLPVLGLVPFHFQGLSTVADRYLYLALIGPALIVAVCLERRPNGILRLVTVMVLLALSVRTWIQLGTWRDTPSLFTHTLSVNDRSFLAHGNLAAWVLVVDKNPQLAMEHGLKAVELNPKFANGWLNLGGAYRQLGKNDLAIAALYRSIELDSNAAMPHHNLGIVYAMRGDENQAMQQFQVAAAINPDDKIAQRAIKEGLQFIREGMADGTPGPQQQ